MIKVIEPDDEGISDVLAVVVSYKPDLDTLQNVINKVIDQVGRVLLFDNATPNPAVSTFLNEIENGPTLVVVHSNTNVGLGAAINYAAKYAKINGFCYLLLLDQDSIPDPGMVVRLKTALKELQQAQPVAAVGPQFRDSRNGRIAPFVRIGFPLSQKLMGGFGQRVSCDFLITSGTLLSIETLVAVGLMDESLFIDNIDLEWCFRAKYSGFNLYGICDATMQHSIGDFLRPSKLKPGGMTVHQPLRLYYIMRNRLLLYRRKETPKIWIAQDIPRLVLKLFSTIMFLTPRYIYFCNIVRGLSDGIRGVSGVKKG